MPPIALAWPTCWSGSWTRSTARGASVAAENSVPAGGVKVYSHRQIMVIMSGLMLGMLLAALDQTIVATALPTIVGDLGGLNHLSWVVTAYLVASTVTTPLYGKFSDIYGRKRTFQFAIVVFLFGSALAGLSQSMIELIAFRGLQGIGAGGLMVLAMTIIGDVVPPRQRGRYQGYMGAVFALASVIGPLLGGFFVDQLSWRWVFYVNLPIGAVALVVTSIVLDLPYTRMVHRIDYAGTALLVSAVGSILLAVTWGGTQYAWSSPVVIGLAVVGAALLAVFVAVERRAAEPVLPLYLFRNRVFAISTGTMFIVGLAMFGGIIYLPLFLQVVGRKSATAAGLLLLPLILGIVVTSISSGRVISRTGRYKAFPVVGMAVMAFGLYLLSTMGPTTTEVTAGVYMTVLGLGLGMVMQVLVLTVQNAVDRRDLGTATGAATFLRSMGGSFGVALFGAVLANRLATNLADLLPGGHLPAGISESTLRGSPKVILSLPAAVRDPVIDAFARSIDTVFLAAVPIALVGFALTLFLPEVPLRTTHDEAPDPLAAGLEALEGRTDEDVVATQERV
jgi:EmrB/QacA subfamily drug resistance transporter